MDTALRVVLLGTFLGLATSAWVGCGSNDQSQSFNFLPPQAGKADGANSALLPADELARLDQKLTAAVAAAEARIASLQDQIATGEADLQSKQSQIDSLISQIEQRKRVVTQNYNNSINVGLLGAFFGFPLVSAVSLVQAMDQDAILQSLNSQLVTAQQQRDQVASEIANYRSRRDAIAAQLAPVEQTYADLKGLLASNNYPPIAAPADVNKAKWGETRLQRGRITTLGKVLDNCTTQITLLQKLLALVSAANDEVNAALTTVKALAEAADQEAERSTELFQSLLKIALSGDPNAAASEWLQDALAAKTRQALAALDWPAQAFVDALLNGVDDATLANALLMKLATEHSGGTSTQPGNGGALNLASPFDADVDADEALHFQSGVLVPGTYTVTLAPQPGDTGDADLYVRTNGPPTLANYDCRPYQAGSNEQCQVTLTTSGKLFVMVHGYRAAKFRVLLGSGATTSTWEGLDEHGTVSQHEEHRYETMVLAAGHYRFALNGTTGDADLYVRVGAAPTVSTYDCRPNQDGSNETCSIELTAPAAVHLMVRGYAPGSSPYALEGKSGS